MKRYLSTISREEAQKLILESTRRISEEEFVSVSDASGRILSRPVYAFISNPSHLLSAMDGYAVESEKTQNADLANPISLEKFTDAIPVSTGTPLPEGKDAVIMVEEVEEDENYIRIRRPANLWQNVRMVGEDTIEGDLLLPGHHRITPYDIGLLLSSGITHVHVLRKPKLVIIPTGKELIDPYEESEKIGKRGYVLDFNSYVLSSLAEELGFDVKKTEIARSEREVEELLQKFIADADAFIINAGTSAGTEDFTEKVVRKMGELFFHGISMMPGKPFLFGKVANKPIFGIPGYPVSAIFCFREFVVPFYHALVGTDLKKEFLSVRVAYKIPSKMGVEELIRVSLVERDEKIYAIPLPRGASLISSVSYSDGIIRVPRNKEGFDEDEEVLCELIRERSLIKNRISMVGSHDMSLSLLRQMVKDVNAKMDLVTVQTGSLGGILALKKGVTHLATTHILDPDEKIYNLPILKKYLAQQKWRLIHIAKRIIGIAVKKGNPKSIRKIEDIANPGVKFVNRQHGSGTRILFDLLLVEKGIERCRIDGYEREEPSHTRVGIMIKESVADCGITIYSVAKLFDLDFIPLAEEDFDLVVSESFVEDEKFRILYGIITSDEFRKKLESFGGYNTSETGRIKYVNG